MDQKTFADLVEKSRRSIQAIELGTLKLSVELAGRITLETGVAIEWLLAGDPAISPFKEVQGQKVPYEKKDFDEVQARLAAGVKQPDTRVREWIVERVEKEKGRKLVLKHTEEKNPLVRASLEVPLAKILSALFSADKLGRFPLAAYRLSEFAKAMEEEFGQLVDNEFCDTAGHFIETSLAHLLTVKPAIARFGAYSRPAESPRAEESDQGERLLDPWHKVPFPERLEGKHLHSEAFKSAIERSNQSREILRTIEAATQPLSAAPLSLHSRTGDVPPPSHDQ